MKTYKLYFLAILIGCTNSVDDLEIGEPFNDAAAIQDEWNLVRVRHVDNLDLNKKFTDISALFLSSSAAIEFTGETFTYSHGSGPNFLDNSGSWAFDDDEFPTSVILNNSIELKLKEPVRQYSDTLILAVERKCEEKTISSYEYYFKRK